MNNEHNMNALLSEPKLSLTLTLCSVDFCVNPVTVVLCRVFG